MRLSGRSALSLNTYRLWSGMSAMVLLVTPSLPWVTAQPPGSLLYVVSRQPWGCKHVPLCRDHAPHGGNPSSRSLDTSVRLDHQYLLF
jgi:hypothetical protein